MAMPAKRDLNFSGDLGHQQEGENRQHALPIQNQKQKHQINNNNNGIEAMIISHDTVLSNSTICGPDGLGTERIYLSATEPPPPPVNVDCVEGMDETEIFAAYVAKESYVDDMLHLILDMDDQQRRTSLLILQCISAGGLGR